MKKIIEAYIPFLIYSIIILVFYFFQYYFFRKYCEALALLSLFLYILFLLYIYIGAFVVSYFLGKIVQKRLSKFKYWNLYYFGYHLFFDYWWIRRD